MKALIKIEEKEIGSETVLAVDARELYGFLKVRRDFSSWIKDRISQSNFIENQDFIIFPETGEKSGRGRPTKAYAITIDMAKELSMVERGKKGKEARKYFIECERKLKARQPKAPQLPDFTNPAVAARAWADQFKGRVLAEQKVAALTHENQTLTEQNAVMAEEVNFMTIDKYCATKGAYLQLREKIRAGKDATKLSERRACPLIGSKDRCFGHVNACHGSVLDADITARW